MSIDVENLVGRRADQRWNRVSVLAISSRETPGFDRTTLRSSGNRMPIGSRSSLRSPTLRPMSSPTV